MKVLMLGVLLTFLAIQSGRVPGQVSKPGIRSVLFDLLHNSNIDQGIR